MLASWTQRLGDLTNAVIGLLAATLAVLVFVGATPTDANLRNLQPAANAEKKRDAHAVSLASAVTARSAPRHPIRGFNILPTTFAASLPSIEAETSGLASMAAPLPASAPGIVVLAYTGLPRALPVFPETVSQLVTIASSPGPDGRDYLIRTLVFEASGETEIGKVAVAHVILNRKRIGRWGFRIADVVTSPWQFEPWMTRKDEIRALSRNDPRYRDAAEVADAVLAGHVSDPTRGATHFLNPVIVRDRRGGSLPAWANGDGQPFGRHVFYCPECVEPARARAAQTGRVERDVAARQMPNTTFAR